MIKKYLLKLHSKLSFKLYFIRNFCLFILNSILLSKLLSFHSLGAPFEISVTTGDKKNAGTSAKVFCTLFGGVKGKQTSGKVWLVEGLFQRSRTDIFKIEVPTQLSPLSKIQIGHDNTGSGPGWFLDTVCYFFYRLPHAT